MLDDYSNGELKKVINEIISAKNKDSLFLFELYIIIILFLKVKCYICDYPHL